MRPFRVLGSVSSTEKVLKMPYIFHLLIATCFWPCSRAVLSPEQDTKTPALGELAFQWGWGWGPAEKEGTW